MRRTFNLLHFRVNCNSCNTEATLPANAINLNIEGPNRCWGCENNVQDFYTCFCESGKATIELQCPNCKMYGEVESL